MPSIKDVVLRIRRPARPDADLRSMSATLTPLVAIADAYDANQLNGMAQRVGCCGPSSLEPENMILCSDRRGRVLLTVADCLKARAAIGGTLNFDNVPVRQSQPGGGGGTGC